MPSTSEYLLRAILELIKKCGTIEELRESVDIILNGEKIDNEKEKDIKSRET